ncbi:MAG: hypothetical protein WCG75_12755 [Armatimonadota bacterium]
MNRRRWNWVWLFLGVIVISASCGFGYEVERARTEFEVAKDAFAKRDWDQVVASLSEEQFNPPSTKYVAFLHSYLDPILDSGTAKLHEEKISSTYVPLENEYVTYRSTDLRDRPLATLSYRDKVAWVTVPFVNQRFWIYKGKQTGMRFVSVFFRVAAVRYPHADRADRWKSVIEFVQHERRHLDDLGISPHDVHPLAKTWEDFMKERTELAKKYPFADYPIRVN